MARRIFSSGSHCRANTRYPPDLLDELRKLAQEHERSLNGEIIWALRQYVEQQKKTK